MKRQEHKGPCNKLRACPFCRAISSSSCYRRRCLRPHSQSLICLRKGKVALGGFIRRGRAAADPVPGRREQHTGHPGPLLRRGLATLSVFSSLLRVAESSSNHRSPVNRVCHRHTHPPVSLSATSKIQVSSMRELILRRDRAAIWPGLWSSRAQVGES
jgi:hypothetical protein